MALFHLKRPGKSGHLDNLNTFCWSQGVHNTQAPLYSRSIKSPLVGTIRFDANVHEPFVVKCYVFTHNTVFLHKLVI